jgi:hypothetical protein
VVQYKRANLLLVIIQNKAHRYKTTTTGQGTGRSSGKPDSKVKTGWEQKPNGQ